MTSPTWAPRASGAYLLSLADLGPDGIEDVLDHAAELKSGPRSGIVASAVSGKTVALIFDQPSLRTRVSFEVGIARLGGSAVTLNGSEMGGLGDREPIGDLARSLSRYVDAIVARILSHETLTELAAAAEVPVINALTTREHPCQGLADLLTLREHLGSLAGRQLVYVGDGNNVCHSLLLGGAQVGLNVRVASPAGYEPAADVVAEAQGLGLDMGAVIEVVRDPVAAVDGADAVYTDVWASMGSQHEAAERRRAFAGYRVSAELLRAAPDALVMHCLPAHRGEEIDAAVIDGPDSVAFDQAENRLYVQQAVLLRLLRTSARIARRSPGPMRRLSQVAAGS